LSQPLRAVIDIEQDGIERRPAIPDQVTDIRFVNNDARIAQALAEDL
jgi:hypothetical protein